MCSPCSLQILEDHSATCGSNFARISDPRLIRDDCLMENS